MKNYVGNLLGKSFINKIMPFNFIVLQFLKKYSSALGKCSWVWTMLYCFVIGKNEYLKETFFLVLQLMHWKFTGFVEHPLNFMCTMNLRKCVLCGWIGEFCFYLRLMMVQLVVFKAGTQNMHWLCFVFPLLHCHARLLRLQLQLFS